MRVVLKAVAGPHRGQNVLLISGQAVQVGRTEWADVAFPQDFHMSGRHFALECDEGTCRLRDLGSTNGTFVNGEPVSETTLGDGDEVRAGQSRFTVHVEGAAPPVKPAEADRTTAVLCDTITGEATVPPQTEPAPRPAPAAAPAADVRPRRPYHAAFADEDPRVRREALLAAARAGQRGLLEHCRRLCDRPTKENFDAIMLLAVLGRPDDLERMLAVGRAGGLGPGRFRALGAYGHPAVVEVLLQAIGSDDPAAAVAAGAAFTKITGAEIDSDTRVQLPPEEGGEPDEFEQEFLEEAVLPSPELAKAHWDRTKDQVAHATRCCRGLDLSHGAAEEILAELDMESRWEARLRSEFEGA